jgi:hypothetical protein
MFEGTDLVLNTESVPSNISYKSFKTWNLPMQNYYCDHRNFGSGNQAILVPRALLTRGQRSGALAKSISNWHLIGYNEGYCSNTGYILLPCFYGIRFWIWPEPLVAPRVRRALGTRMRDNKL